MKTLKRITAMTLALCMFGTCGDWSPIAKAAGKEEETVATETTIVAESYEEPKNITKTELKEERTRNTTTWQLSDGHKQVVYYSNDVRFEDDNGKLVDYDASLISVQQAKSVEGADLEGYAYENKQGDMKHYIPKEMDENTPLRLENGEYSLEVSPMFVTSKDTKEVAVQKEKVTDIYGKTKEKKVAAVYEATDKTLELEYVPFDMGVKENIILNEKPDTNVWQFSFTLGGGLIAKKDAGAEGISFYTKEEQELVGGIQVPYMNDATGKNYSEAITYDLETVSEEEGRYILTMTVDTDYLNSEKTVYPVTIDPSYTWNGNSALYDVYVLSGTDYVNMNFYSNTSTCIYAGRTKANGKQHTYIGFKDLATKVKGYSVASAKLTMYETGGGTAGETVEAHRVKEEWNKATICWNNRAFYNAAVISSFINKAKENNLVSLDLTSYVRNIAEGTEDYGIMLRTTTEEVSKYSKFYGSRHASTQYRPKLTVTYIEKPTEASSVSVASYWLKKDAAAKVTWKGINSSALKNIQYRVALLSDDGKEFVNTEYAPYASNPVIGTTASGTASIKTSALGEGCFRVYVRGVDKYGSVGKGKGASFVVDGTAPTLTSASITPTTSATAGSNNARPTIKWSGAADKYLKQVQYSVDGGSYASMGTTASGSFTLPAGKITSTGKHTIKVCAIDKAGNMSAVKTLTYYYTTDKPVIGKIHVSEDKNGVQVFLDNVKEAGKVFQGGSISWAVVAHGSKPADSNYTTLSGSITSGRLISTVTNLSKTDGIYDVYVKIKNSQGLWSEPAIATLYHFPKTVYDGDLSLVAESVKENVEESDSWKLKWDTENVTSADLYVSLDGEDFVKKQTIKTGEIQLDFSDVDSYAMYRICATYTNGSKKLSDIITMEKIAKDDAVDEMKAELKSSLGAAVVSEMKEKEIAEYVAMEAVAATTEGKSATVYYYRQTDKDSDADGIDDGYEMWDFGSNIEEADTDGDGFDDRYEIFVLGTNPAVYTADTDSDGDGLTNLQEKEKGTDPYLADSDFDGINDAADTEPRKTDTKSGKTVNYQVSVHKGLYDLEQDGQIFNPYSSLSKKIVIGGSETLQFYDDSSNLTTELTKSDGKNYLNTYTWNGNDQKIYMTYNGLAYSYTYDSMNNILTVDVNGKRLVQYVYGYDYDEDEETGASYKSNSYLLRVNYANGGNVRYQYEDMDVLSMKEDENGNMTTETKTEHKLAYVKVDGKATDSTYSYNEYGNVTKYVDSESGVTYNYTYDSKQNLMGITGDNGFSMTTNSTDNSDEKAGKTSYTTNTTWKLGQEEKKVHYSYESTEESKTETAVTDLITGKQQTVQRNLENGNETVKIGDNISWNATQEEKQGKISYKNGSYLLYTYDDNGNITRISEKSDSNAAESILATYTYDGMSQLLRENNRQANTTTIYSYDTNGNLTESKVYPYTEGNVSGNPTTTHTWNYKNSDWRDLLTEYDGSTITYDAGGNPLTYRNGSSLTWQGGRQLKQYEDSKQTVNYTYNGEGIRTKKTVTDKATGKTVTKNYYLDNSNILAEKVSGSDNDRTIWYAYSGEGKLTGFTYDGADYYYQRNLQDDIIGIYDASGKKVVSYTYDAWGKLTNLTDDSGKNLGEINPFRYRGYYYDEDTSWYYLQSRYYDVEVGRFLNADDVNYQGNQALSTNLFTYCLNNPVKDADVNGNVSRILLGAVFSALVAYVLYWVEWYLGYRKWSWPQMVAIVATSAVLGAYKWALFGGKIPKMTRYVGLLERGHATKKEVKIISKIFYARKEIVKALLKTPNKKKGEGWGKFIRNSINFIARYL